MTKLNIDKHLEGIPEEVIIIVDGIGNKTRLALLSYLNKQDGGVKFNEIAIAFGVENSIRGRNVLVTELRKLLDAGLVEQMLVADEDDITTEYRITDLGRHVMNNIYKLFFKD